MSKGSETSEMKDAEAVRSVGLGKTLALGEKAPKMSMRNFHCFFLVPIRRQSSPVFLLGFPQDQQLENADEMNSYIHLPVYFHSTLVEGMTLSPSSTRVGKIKLCYFGVPRFRVETWLF